MGKERLPEGWEPDTGEELEEIVSLRAEADALKRQRDALKQAVIRYHGWYYDQKRIAISMQTDLVRLRGTIAAVLPRLRYTYQSGLYETYRCTKPHLVFQFVEEAVSTLADALSSRPRPDPRDKRIAELETALRAWERWEADIILEGDCWREEDGLPHLTQELWDRVIELQSLRNAALSGHPTPDPKDALVEAAVRLRQAEAKLDYACDTRQGSVEIEAAIQARQKTIDAVCDAVAAYLKERGDV